MLCVKCSVYFGGSIAPLPAVDPTQGQGEGLLKVYKEHFLAKSFRNVFQSRGAKGILWGLESVLKDRFLNVSPRPVCPSFLKIAGLP